ncbi:hypothetical protein FQA39_LY08272 [Lamprigera yunnana]|nr:hypothetical protein FQA39_LY08272 [Lamprigera yunnana]
MVVLVLMVYICTFLKLGEAEFYVPGTAVSDRYQSKYAPHYNYKSKDYAFEYGVSDPKTGDHKLQWEKKENGVTIGMYSLVEPDGSKRVVEYVADKLHGFRALVKRIPPFNSPQHSNSKLQVVERHGFNNENNYASTNENADKDRISKYEGTHENNNGKLKQGPINKETEDVESRDKEEQSGEQDSGYIIDDHENEKNEESNESSYNAPYNSGKLEDDDDD